MSNKITVHVEEMHNGVADGFIFRDPSGLPFMGPVSYVTPTAAHEAAVAAYPPAGFWRNQVIVSAEAVGIERLELVIQ